jgi:hypothetical protein
VSVNVSTLIRRAATSRVSFELHVRYSTSA